MIFAIVIGSIYYIVLLSKLMWIICMYVFVLFMSNLIFLLDWKILLEHLWLYCSCKIYGCNNFYQVDDKILHLNIDVVECCITDTIPGRQCMASCFFLLKQFEDVLIYLNSIRVIMPVTRVNVLLSDELNWTELMVYFRNNIKMHDNTLTTKDMYIQYKAKYLQSSTSEQ